MGWILWLGGGLVGLVVAVLSFQVLSMRTGWEPGVKAIRKFTRLMNPRQMRTAGQPGAYAAVVRHVGRRTGTLTRHRSVWSRPTRVCSSPCPMAPALIGSRT